MPDYQSDYKNNFVKHGIHKVQAIDPNLMKNHFEIGDRLAPSEQGSCYHRDMQKFGPDIYKQAIINENAGRDKKSNWDFGNMDNNWQSEARNK